MPAIKQDIRAATFVVAADDSLHKNMADYVCDGVNDHLEIQAAIDALPATGGEVFLLDGTYYIEVSLVLDSYQTLRGCGRNTILTTTTASLYFITATGSDGSEKIGIFIADLCIDGAAIAECGIYLIYVDYSKIWNIWAEDIPDWAALWIQTCDHNEIIGNTFQNSYSAIYLGSSNNNTISGNTCQGHMGGEAIGLDSSSRNIISGNICLGNNRGITLSGSSNNTISSNICHRNNQEGIYLSASSDHNVISGNVCVENSQLSDISNDNIHIANSDYNLIEGNFCRAPTIGTTLTVGEPIGETEIAVTDTAGFEVGLRVVIDLGGGNEEYHRISAITAGAPGVITIDAGLTNAQGAGETIDVPEARYGINVRAGSTGNLVINNDLYSAGKTGDFNDDATAIGTIAHEQYSDLFMDVLAVSVNYVVAAQALGADPTVCAIAAQPDMPRTLSWTITHPNLTNYTLTIVGVNAKGQTVTETWTDAGWAGETSHAYATVISVTMSAMTGNTGADTIDVGITDVLGLSNVIYATGDVYKIKKNAADAVVAGAQVDTDYDTYDMAVIGLAVGDDFTIWFRSNLNRTS